jgi:hypothetical protein
MICESGAGNGDSLVPARRTSGIVYSDNHLPKGAMGGGLMPAFERIVGEIVRIIHRKTKLIVDAD